MKLDEVAKEPEFTGALAKFDKWYCSHDLWHRNFPAKFEACVSDYLPDADSDVLDKIGVWFSDNLTSMYADKVQLFIEYAKKNAPPEMQEEWFDDEDAFEKAIETYCKAALESMYPQSPKEA